MEGQYGVKHRVRIYWQIKEKMDSGKPFLVGKTYTLSLHKKSSLRPDLESWRGRPFTEVEAEGFDLEKLLGANCQLNLMHTSKDGETYTNVQAIVPAHKEMMPLKPEDYIRKCDRDDWVEPKGGEAQPQESDSYEGEPEETVPF